MKICHIFCRFALPLFLAIMISGCGGVNSSSMSPAPPPPSTPPSTPPPPSPPPPGANPHGTFLYVGNRFSNNVSGFRMNSDGTLTALSGSPFSVSAWNIAVSKNFLLTATTDLVSYQIDPSSGGLTKVSSVPIPGAPTVADQSRALAADANNAYAFGKDANANYAMHGFSVSANGSFTAVAGSPFLWGNGCSLCASPFMSVVNSQFLMTAGAGGNQDSGNITVFARGQDGTLAPKQTLGSNAVSSVALHPSGKFGYAVHDSDGLLIVLNIASNGQLTERTAFFDNGGVFRAVATEPGGKFLLVVDEINGGSRLQAFAVNATTGDLTAVGSPVPTGGTRGSAVTVDPTNHFAIVSNGHDLSASNDLVVFSFNPDTGAVTKIQSVPSGGKMPQMPFIAVL